MTGPSVKLEIEGEGAEIKQRDPAYTVTECLYYMKKTPSPLYVHFPRDVWGIQIVARMVAPVLKAMLWGVYYAVDMEAHHYTNPLLVAHL